MKANISQQEIQQTAVRLGIPDHPFVARRIARAYNLVETNKVNEISHDDGLYRVHSQHDDKIYTVEVNHGNPSCSCPDGKKTVHCKHMIASLMVAQGGRRSDETSESHREREQKAPALVVKKKENNERIKASWIVTDGTVYTTVWQDLNGKICCVCGAYYKRDCIHKQAIRDAEGVPSFDGIAPRIENECGTSEAKSLQDNLNGNNGTGDTQSPVRRDGLSSRLDTSDPFQECERLDIDQIEGRSNGDLVHVLSNGEYVVSYRGIMNLANKHGVTFDQHTDEQEAKETRTVIAYGRCGGNSRASGKPANGNFTTAVELAKRNAARQLLPLPEIKALEHKAKLEAEAEGVLTKRQNRTAFDWEVAKRKCLEIVPDFTFDILIHDLVKAGTLRQAHPSDYNRKEWLVIFDACKRDAETNGNDDDVETHGEAARLRLCAPGDDTPSSDDEQRACDRTRQAVCCICARTLTNKLSVSRCIGPECFKKVGAEGAQFLRDDEVSDELIKASKLYQDESLQKRIVKSCLTLDAPLPTKVLRWLGNEYFGYRSRPVLYYVCADGQLSRIDTHRRKLRHRIITSETAETELDAHALAQMAADVVEPSELSAGIPQDEFIAKCKQAEVRHTGEAFGFAVCPQVEDTTADDAHPTNGDGKRKLQMGKDRIVWLIEADGAKKQIDYPEAERMKRNSVLRLTQGIQLCGADISTVELDD